jgi:hypothetical protein
VAEEALGKEVGSEIRDPVECVEAHAGFEHEEGNRLLDEQTNNDGPPLDGGPVPRRRPETKREHDETHHEDCVIAIFCALTVESGSAGGGRETRGTARTSSSLKLKAEPRTTAMMESGKRVLEQGGPTPPQRGG